MTTLNLRPEGLALAETLRIALYESNRLDGYHALQVGGTFGGILEGLRKCLWCEIRTTDSTLTPHQIDEIVKRLEQEMFNNGENVEYQIDLLNNGRI